MTKYLQRLDHYILLIDLIVLLGSISFLVLSRKDQKTSIYRLLLSSLILVFVYENVAYYLASGHIGNNWVYLIFYGHFATWVNLLIIKEFILNPKLKRVIVGFVVAILIFSGIPCLFGYIPWNSSGEYTSFLTGSLMIISCGIFFYELLTNDGYLNINPLHFSGFWIVTFLLFFYSASFMILISHAYLVKNYLDVYVVVFEITRHSALALYVVYLITLVRWNVLATNEIDSIYE